MLSPITIAAVKDRADIVAVVGEAVKLQRKGRTWKGLCPFHKEKTPSFTVNPERRWFHCFGCKESGNAVDFVMKTDGKTFVEAVRFLAERFGVEIEETRTDRERAEAAAAKKARDDLYGANLLAMRFYEAQLWGAPGIPQHVHAALALDELRRRGIDGQQETVRAFGLGYAPPAWDALASYFQRQGLSPAVAERVGLLVPRQGGGYYDRFRSRLMFPVHDAMGRVVAFSGRLLPDPQGTKGEPGAKYVNSPESPVYQKGAHLFGLWQAKARIRQANEAVLVEGNFDVVGLHARGIGTAVAPLGTAFTPEQAKLLKRFAPAVTVFFDADDAGRKAVRAARIPLREAGLGARVAVPPSKMDPDELAQKHGRRGVEGVLTAAKGLMEWLIEDAFDEPGFARSSLYDQLARVRAVADLLAEEQDPEMRRLAKMYADRVAQQLSMVGGAAVDMRQLERIIGQRLAKQGGPADGRAQERAPAPRAPDGAEQLHRAILGAMLDAMGQPLPADVRDLLGVLEGDVAIAVWIVENTPGPDADELLSRLPEQLRPFARGRLAAPRYETAAAAWESMRGNARKLRALADAKLQQEWLGELDDAEREGRMEDVERALAELEAIARRNAGR